MEIIDKQVAWYTQNANRKEDAYIQEHLKLINNLAEHIENSEDLMFIEKIVSTFCEIMEMQRQVIAELEGMEVESSSRGFGLASIGKTMDGYLSARRLTADDIPWSEEEEANTEIDRLRELNSYMPLDGEFKSDDQIKRAFSNYLQYHIEARNGKPKRLSQTTAYDYSSRIKVLWEVIEREWKEGKLEGIVPFFAECIMPGYTFLNAYNNIQILETYVLYKSSEIRQVENGDKEAFTEQDYRKNPLNNPRNLRNSAAALEKFREFKVSVEKQL